MGVPSFYKWLIQRCPTSKREISDMPNINNFYLDMNGIIHTFFSRKEETFQQIFDSLFAYLIKLINIVMPTELIFFSIDGVAPQAKMNQQRSRRYNPERRPNTSTIKLMKSYGFTDEDIYNDTKKFDSNVISPGTEFSVLFNKKMNEFIDVLTEVLDNKITIILSDSTVQGEGEHKIFNYIRNKKAENNNRDNKVTHCIYGNDADLIFLSLVSHEPHFFILRPDWFAKDKENILSLIDIEMLREYLYTEFKEISNKDIERIIDDFVLLCIFVGNDFIPNVPLMHIHTGGIDEIIEIYKRASVKFNSSYITTEKGGVDISNLKIVLELMVKIEEQKIIEVSGGVKSKIKKYKETYIDNKFKFYSNELIENVSHSYIKSLLWVYQYYYNGIPSWNWFYPFHYAPFFSSLYQHIDTFAYPIFDINEKPNSPFEQLLSILPPWSSHALPSCLGALMEDISSDIIDLYPSKIFHDDNDQKFTYMGINLAPFSDSKRIHRAVNSRLYAINEAEKKRNSFWKSVIINKGKRKEYDIDDMFRERERSVIVGKVSFIKERRMVKGSKEKYCGKEAIKRIEKVLNDVKRNKTLDNFLYMQRKRDRDEDESCSLKGIEEYFV